jgi:hypothetical protein
MAETVRKHPAGKQPRALSHYSYEALRSTLRAFSAAPNKVESVGGMHARCEKTNVQIVVMSARIGATVVRAWID